MPSSAPTDPRIPAALNGKGKVATAADPRVPAPLPPAHMKKLSHTRLSQLVDGLPKDGSPLRWGLAVATGAGIEPRRLMMSELGCGNGIPKKLRTIDIATELNWLLQQVDTARAAAKPDLSCLIDALLWAYALPMVEPLIGEASLAALCGSLEQLSRHCESIHDVSSLARLIGGGELGLVLGWRRKKQTDSEFLAAAADCVKQWCESPEASLGFSVRPGLSFASADLGPGSHRSGSPARAVIASLIRSRALCSAVAKRKLKKPQLDTIADLATWVAAATRVGGTAAFSTATARDVRDDTAQNGLLDQVKQLDPDTLGPAIDAAAGRSHTGGRLAWQISLPESYCHSELGGMAIFLPEWDVRRGRMYLDYGGDQMRLQLDAGKLTAVDGTWELLIQVDEQEQTATGPWTSLCEYTDDDVHYLELEQRWSGGIRVQRHLLLIREDRCVMLADAVIRNEDQAPAKLSYTSRLRLADQVIAAQEEETTELWLQDQTGERRGLVLSLQSNEWRIGPTRARLDVSSDAHLRLEVSSDRRNSHGGSIFAPLWFDFQQRRFKRPRTWRQLTVAEDLRIVDPDEAAAYRVQHGSEQWIVYRMLHGDRTRTFLGKHLLADLFCARFHASDGGMEDLVTVGGTDDDDESPE